MKAFLEKLIRWVASRVMNQTSDERKVIRIVWKNARHESAAFIEKHLSNALLFETRKEIWDFVLDNVDSKGLHIECGVYKGESINYFARKKTKVTFYGFDSFEGLDEDWVGHHERKGKFNLDGILPKVENNVALLKGRVEDVYENFLKEKDSYISFLHIDTDLYLPAKVILGTSLPFLQKGSVILLDELIGYPGWQLNEFRALSEVLAEIKYEYIAFSERQAAIKISE